MSDTAMEWKGGDAIVLESYDATALLNAPFKVTLKHSVKQVLDGTGAVTETIVPDPDGLIKAVAQLRVLHPHKLNGADLRFLRSALGVKAKELAKSIKITAEHMSRLEANDKVLSPQSEMLVRIFTYVSAFPFTSKRDAEAAKVVDQVGRVFGSMNIRSCHSIDDEVDLVLRRVSVNPHADIGDDDGTWDDLSEQAAA